MVAECEDGYGSEEFYQTFAANRTIEDILLSIKAKTAHETTLDQWQVQILAEVLSRNRVILVSRAPDNVVKQLRMTPARTINEALILAAEFLNKDNGTITLIPQGNSIVIKENKL